MKKFLFALIAVLFVAAQVSAQAPVRIARLPIIFRSRQPDIQTRIDLEVKLARAVHIPMNGTLKVAEYITPVDAAKVLGDIWQAMRTVNKKAKIQDAMRPLAEELDADLIVCPILLNYNETVGGAFTASETYLDSQVRAQLVIYDRRSDSLVDKKTSRMYHDAMSRFGTAAFLATECFDRLIAETKLRETIIAIGK